VVEMGVLSIPLAFGLGAIALALLLLGYEMASAWLSYRKAFRRGVR